MPSSSGRSPGSLGPLGISRRDFLNGCVVASGGLAIGRFAPLRALATESGNGVCGDVIGNDPRFLRGGNLPSAFNVAHWLRDQRLSFAPGTVTLAPGCDAHDGKFDISDGGGDVDVIIVGAGLAGLSAAFFLLRQRPGTRILLLEVRLSAVALRIDADVFSTNPAAHVTYFKDGNFHRASARSVIVATQASSARHLVGHLLDADRKAAWDEFNTVPALVANVAVRNMARSTSTGGDTA
jgi:hypothetical protein